MAGRLRSFLASPEASVAWLGTAALLAFLALIAFEGWRGYAGARVELKADIAAHARLVSEHVERTFQTVEIVFDSVRAELGSHPWPEIAASRAFYYRIRALSDALPQIRSIWLTDQNGRMRAFSDRWPTPELDAFEREYFTVHALDGVGTLHAGRPLTGKFTGKPFVPVSMPLMLDYSFRGVVTAAVEPNYYLPLLAAEGRCSGCTTALFRPDGEVLFSTGAEPRLGAALVDGLSRMIVSDAYPIAVAVWVPQSALLRLWWARENGLVLSGLAAAGLLAWLLLRAVRASTAAARERDHLRQAAEALASKNRELDEAGAAAEASRRLEKRLREAAAAANLAKSQFLALMSHELRTPLNAIIGFSEILRGPSTPVPPDKVAEYAEDIHSSGTHLLSLINDILDLSKIEAGKFELEEEEIELGEIAREATRLIEMRFAAKSLAIDCRSFEIPVLGDPRALRQVLFNILSNAGKFTANGGRVTVDAGVTRDWIQLSVTDDGCGMDEQDLERAMTPFGQAAAPLARQTEGTGLGLNITKSLLELHGGRLEIDSARDRGTTVSVLLPLWRLLEAAGVAGVAAAAAR